MLNTNTFINKNEISKEGFDEMIKNENLEVYTPEAVGSFVSAISSIIKKSESGEMSAEELSSIDIAKAEIGNLRKYVVVDEVEGRVVKIPLYVQEQMVDFEKGVYHDNSVNRKLGRVGKPFGGKTVKENGGKTENHKEEIESGKKKYTTDEKDYDPEGYKNWDSEKHKKHADELRVALSNSKKYSTESQKKAYHPGLKSEIKKHDRLAKQKSENKDKEPDNDPDDKNGRKVKRGKEIMDMMKFHNIPSERYEGMKKELGGAKELHKHLINKKNSENKTYYVHKHENKD
jgi:hypothetical protein